MKRIIFLSFILFIVCGQYWSTNGNTVVKNHEELPTFEMASIEDSIEIHVVEVEPLAYVPDSVVQIYRLVDISNDLVNCENPMVSDLYSFLSNYDLAFEQDMADMVTYIENETAQFIFDVILSDYFVLSVYTVPQPIVIFDNVTQCTVSDDTGIESISLRITLPVRIVENDQVMDLVNEVVLYSK